jgi:hypothetical protein
MANALALDSPRTAVEASVVLDARQARWLSDHSVGDRDPVLDSGTDHPARSAASLSAHERTVPFRMTLLPCTSTVIRCASVSAVRINACFDLLLELRGPPVGAVFGRRRGY